ncbi:protein CONSERVED ONLY IN THE GREEN LINEAGE 160, chloroplastic isoform X1 [Curcuma longa]|uniref:protein CONSERVED ONLY IN THE GREEN LINEAGE 160, chloroplastic isoform X1 n=1 Tax=Curcuma longa TaxID=136217 RepID=UPI003D9E6A25
MAVLTASACSTYRLAIRSEAHSAEEDPSPTLPTRIVLPKKKPVKWSTGVAPGEYGGPPTTTKLRKYWGGGDEDPVTATDDFIWNKEFLGRMQQLLDGDESNPNSAPSLNKEPDSGFLSLNRSMSLDSMEVDLSKELMPPPKPVLEQQVEAARNGLSFTEIVNDASSPRWRFVPTRREQAKWDRATKAATGGSELILRESKQDRGDPKVLAAQSRQQYLKLKQKLQILTASIGGIGVVSAYFTYTPEIAVSFGAGLIGSLAYIRMLGNTVDSMANGAKGIMKGAVGQPRLLVPVILVMMYNRWNEVLVPDYGFMHLELIPMLLGFFTYKVATFVQALQEAIDIVGKKS